MSVNLLRLLSQFSAVAARYGGYSAKKSVWAAAGATHSRTSPSASAAALACNESQRYIHDRGQFKSKLQSRPLMIHGIGVIWELRLFGIHH